MQVRYGFKGFTFVEVLLTVTVLGVMAGVVGRMLVVGLDTYAAVTNRSAAVQQGRAAINRITEELWRVPAGGLTLVSDTEIDFVDANLLPASFRQDSAGAPVVLRRGNDLLAPAIGYLDFDAYDGLGLPAGSAVAARRIGVELNCLNTDGSGSVTFRTEVFPRGFMYQGFQ